MSGRRSSTDDGSAAGNVHRRPASDTPCTEIAASTRSFGERPEQDAERIGALDDFALELMHRDSRRGGIGLGALERELVALARIEADLLQPQRFLARRQRVAGARELLGCRDQPEIAARDVAGQAQLGRFATELRVQQLRARRLGGALVATPQIQLVADRALHGVDRPIAIRGRGRCSTNSAVLRARGVAFDVDVRQPIGIGDAQARARLRDAAGRDLRRPGCAPALRRPARRASRRGRSSTTDPAAARSRRPAPAAPPAAAAPASPDRRARRSSRSASAATDDCPADSATDYALA